MSRTNTYDAVVLRTFNVGEADRLCILFTKELGRIAARAHGARKVGSRSGGMLLPFRRITVDLYINNVGATIRSVRDCADTGSGRSFGGFMEMERATELVLALTEDDHPLPEVFDLVCEYIALPAHDTSTAFHAFRLRLLHLLGLLPATDDDARFRMLSSEVRYVVEACAGLQCDLHTVAQTITTSSALDVYIGNVVEHTIDRPLRSDLIASGMLA